MSAVIPSPVLRELRCPLCQSELHEQQRRVFCAHGHSFDRARQGHVFLRAGTPLPVNADTTEMVTARERIQTAGIFAEVRRTAAQMLQEHVTGDEPLILDLAGGTGYYLSGVLDALPSAHGVCNELSTAALRRAARAHPRMAAVGFDVREEFPLASHSVAAVTSFFGPRNANEILRMLRPDGVLLVATPTASHLAELAAPLGMLRVDARKEERLRTTLDRFRMREQTTVQQKVSLSREQAFDVVRMGPSAHHTTAEEVAHRVAALPEHITVSIDVRVALFRRAQK